MSLNTKKIVVLISGYGTNLQSIIDNCINNNINGEIKVVISNKKDAYGLIRAQKANIDTKVITDNKELLIFLLNQNIDLIILAGYLKILPEEIINAFKSRIINIHPSLIPSFCGMGFYGMRVHEAVFKKGVRYTGATTHFVTKDADEGPIIYQKIIEIKEDYNIETIANKVLEKEHEILVKSVKDFCDDKLYIKDNKVYTKK
ncbi:phosphoribosylglycinamide formyltransferase [Anaerococcus porci]|uniref:phosphoribosylglycinamide formyltransferase n=1 Tax=Anaerococcus porci TaxID=2652269 RepID=UPI002A757226|nr:phosphoribosylglycinamide formyltransferase [Anaerococcus porci]MDY3006679.1 phosphoribosylglycinamide formyltransferase [Anaerococcus porci]